MKQILSIPILVCLAFGVRAQDPGVMLTKEQAVQDIRELAGILSGSHPDPCSVFGGKAEYERRIMGLIDSIPADGISVGRFGNLLQYGFLVKMRDGHTTLFLRNDRWRDPSRWYPVSFTVTADRTIFVRGYDPEQIRGCTGYILRGVNGVSIEGFLGKKLFYKENIYGDLISLTSTVRSDKFLLNCGIDTEKSGGVTYNLESPSGVKKDVFLPGDISRPWDAAFSYRGPEWEGLTPCDSMFCYRVFRQQQAAYLRIGAVVGREAFEMWYREQPEEGKSYIEQYYRQQKTEMPGDTEKALQGIPSLFETTVSLLKTMKARNLKNLIVDLRSNGGGNTMSAVPSLLLMFGDRFYENRFMGEFVTVVSNRYLEMTGKTPGQWRTETDNPWFEPGDYKFDRGNESGSPAERYRKVMEGYAEKGFHFAGTLKELDGKPLYTPEKVMVLCDARTFSAAFHLLFYLDAMGAVTVGVPSSQSPNGPIDAMNFTLGESGIRGIVSHSSQVFVPEDPGAKVYHLDYEMDYKKFKEYGFDNHAPLRNALDLIKTAR